jgi:hypothetical protein
LVPVERIELPTFGLQNRCSTAELNRPTKRSQSSHRRLKRFVSSVSPQSVSTEEARRQIPELPGEGYRHETTPKPPIAGCKYVVNESFYGSCVTIQDHRTEPVGISPVAEPALLGGRPPDCDGGSRACAMLTRQASCEVEMVPSLHSNLAGAASATGADFSAGLSAAAAGCGADASATGFWNRAQATHESAISTTTPNRICVAPATALAAKMMSFIESPSMGCLNIQRPRMIRTRRRLVHAKGFAIWKAFGNRF